MKRFWAAAALIVLWPARAAVARLQRLRWRRRDERRVLVIHFGGLGDTLMLTPALRALKEHYPQARLDLITLHENVSHAFRSQSFVNSIAVLPAYSGQWIVSRFANLSGAKLVARTIRYYPELLLQLGFARYDVAINFGLADFDRRVGNALMRCLGIPVRVGVADGPDRFVTHSVRADRLRQQRVDAYFCFLEPLGITKTQSDYEYAVGSSDLKHIEFVLRDCRIDQTRRLAVIHPGGKLHVNSRRWPPEYFARVCEFLSAEGFEVVLTGDGEDSAVCNEVARRAQSPAVSLAGRLNFSQTAALLAVSDLVVTNDTGTLHLAEAVKVPRVISIFGPTDPGVLAPRNGRHIIFRSSLPCAPCMGGTIDAATERCWREVKEECLWQTTPDQVIAALRDVYSGSAARFATA